MQQPIPHIDIPLDQLNTFSCCPQSHQHILTETLLLSTLCTVHTDRLHKCHVFITLKSIIFYCSSSSKKGKEKLLLTVPLGGIQAIVKSQGHPEMVVITGGDWDNVRVTCSCEERCWYIVSAVSYGFTYVRKKGLEFITIKHQTLDFFYRTKQDKAKDKNVNMGLYKKSIIKYQKPFKDMTNIYGYLKQKSKIILQKQLQSIGEQRTNHMVYLARIKNQLVQPQKKHQQSSSNGSDPAQVEQLQDRYICHYIQKTQQYLQQIYQHKNIDFITQLMFAKATDFKIQIFFQFSRTLRGSKITQIVFWKIWHIYDKCKQVDRNCVFTTDSLLLVQRTGILGEKVRRNQTGSDFQQRMRWVNGENQIVMRQFRYQFLNQAVQWDRFLYEPNFLQPESQAQPQPQSPIPFSQKCYTIGLILYQLTTGRHLLSYLPAFINDIQILEQQVQLIYHLKQIIKKEKIQIFPQFLDLGIEEQFQEFIECCIFGGFRDEVEMGKHPWLSKNGNGRQKKQEDQGNGMEKGD